MKFSGSLLVLFLLTAVVATALEKPAAKPEPVAQPGDTIFINEYRVEGARKLSRRKIEEAVYPYLGPGRTKDDVELARAALERAYFAEGFQTVAVVIPPQQVAKGVVHLQVIERTVGRLRVKGARYSSPKQIKAMAPSLAEGGVIDFNQVTPDVVALNQLPDRQVTPSLHAGVEANTVDVDLDVKEKAPVHASVELNNRQSPNTKPLRVNASVSLNNLGQTGHSLGFSFQTAPQEFSQLKIFSGYYLARAVGADWLNLMLQGTKQDSDVSTLGDTAVLSRGTTAGLRFMVSLPAIDTYTQSANFGFDYKHFKPVISLSATASSPSSKILAPINYFPLTAGYAGTWQGKTSTTEFDTGVSFHVRGLGSSTAQFNTSRYQADGSFIIFRGTVAHTHELWAGFQAYGKVTGQFADQALVSGEQIAGGGMGTARGYLEGEEVGDSGLFTSFELRSPSLLHQVGGAKADWRIYAFVDSGWLKVIDPLTDQHNHFDFLSYGVGSRVHILDHLDGEITAGFPQLKEGYTKAHTSRITFKAGYDY